MVSNKKNRLKLKTLTRKHCIRFRFLENISRGMIKCTRIFNQLKGLKL